MEQQFPTDNPEPPKPPSQSVLPKEKPSPSQFVKQTDSGKPKNGSNFLVTFLSLLLLLAVGAAGFFAWQTQNLVKQVNELKSQPTPESSATPQATTDPTADWKTYTNTEYGFSLKYPQENDSKIEFSLVENYEGGYCYQWTHMSNIDIAGKKVRVDSGSYTGQPEDICKDTDNKDSNVVQAFLPIEGSVELFISIHSSSTNKETLLEKMDQILSTFEFTNTESPSPTATSSSTPTN